MLRWDWIEEWLVDRKRIPGDWRKRLAAVRARISKEFASLPKDINPYFSSLEADGWFFFELNPFQIVNL